MSRSRPKRAPVPAMPLDPAVTARQEVAPAPSELPPSFQPLIGAWRFGLPLLLVIYVALAGFQAWITPIGYTGLQNAPDEAAHLVYVETLASGQLPSLAQSRQLPSNMPGYEWHQPPLYYGVLAPLFKIVFEPMLETAHWSTIQFSPNLRWLRLISILCGVGSLLLTFRAARLLFPNNPNLAVVAAGVVALTPSHIAITAAVNNDALLELGFTASLLLMIRSLTSGYTGWRAGWLGVLLGLTLLTKATGLLLLPVWVLALWCYGHSGQRGASVLRGAATTLAILLLISGWWFVRNYQLYGEFLPLRTFQAEFRGTSQARDWVIRPGGWPAYWQLVGQWSFQSFWAVFGRRQDARIGIPRFLPDQVYQLLALLCAGVGAGMARLHWRRKQEFTHTQHMALWLLFATLALVLASFILFLATYFQTQGRYLYPAMLPIALIVGLGWRAIFPARYREAASAGLLTFLLLLCLLFASATQAAYAG